MCVCGERNLVQTYLGVLIDYFLKSTTILHIEQLLFFFSFFFFGLDNFDSWGRRF